MYWKREDVGDFLKNLEDELKAEVINSLSLDERAKRRARRCGTVPPWEIPKDDIKRCRKYNKAIEKINKILKESKKNGYI